jgi:outer membrane protein assembly factor BamB
VALALELLPPLELNRRFLYADLRGGAWVWLLLVPFLAIEVATTWALELPTRRGPAQRRREAVALAARLAFVAAYFWAIAVRAAQTAHTPDIHASLVVRWPHVFLLSLRTSPRLAALLLVSVGVAFALLTVRRCRWRLTTTALAPGIGAMAIFQLFYFYPGSAWRLERHARAPEAERVFPAPGLAGNVSLDGTTFFARDLHVGADEQTVVGTFGRTFALLGVVSLPTPSLVQIDLGRRTYEARWTSVIRRFQSTCDDRLFMSPWHGSRLLEVDPATRAVTEHVLPDRVNGFSIEEINWVLNDCGRGRVYAGNSRNPVVFVWDARRGELARELNLVGTGGVRLGDSVGLVLPNPATRRVYVGMFGTWHLVELDEDTLAPTRFLRLEEDPWDVALSPDGAFLYVSAWFVGRISKIDARTLEVVARFDVPPHSRRVQPTPDGSTLVVVSYLTGEVLALDARTGEERRRMFVAPKPEGLYVSAHYAWVSASDGIYRIPLSALAPGGGARAPATVPAR